MSDQTDPPSAHISESRFDRGPLRQEVQLEIRRLHQLSNRGLWGLALFILISLGAQQDFKFLPPISDGARAVLGAAPPVMLISIALVVYSFSALILILSRMMGGSDSYRGWAHLGYLSAFYAFYYYAEALPENFWAIFAAGFTILALEYYQIWTYCSDAIRTEKELLSKLED
ncbi:menaquinol oxidoreductase [Trichloromonas sp.]|uniref:menaquinol oxidoreductase n=1 Tax=Trichloromonas sp. TaxID=3069249 RepID=UPI003D81321E